MSEPLNADNPSGPVNVGEIEVTIDRDACIGASACIPPADKTFTLDDDGKAIVMSSASENDEADIVDAARACPVMAIKVTKNGEDLL